MALLKVDGGRVGLALLITTLALIAAPAAAQRGRSTDTGTIVPTTKAARISDSAKLSDETRARLAAADYARCAVDRIPTRVSQTLALPFGGSQYEAALPRLMTSDCLESGMISFRRPLLRGALFVELYRRRMANQPSGAMALPTLTKVSFATNPLVHPDEAQVLHEELMSLANCVIGKDEAHARDAILLPTASKGQEAALIALVPSLGACLPAGMKLTFSRPVLEGNIAEMLYRGAETPTDQPVGTK